jgi:hypothetical protein
MQHFLDHFYRLQNNNMANVRKSFFLGGAPVLTAIEMNVRHFVGRQITEVRAHITRQLSHLQITSLRNQNTQAKRKEIK